MAATSVPILELTKLKRITAQSSSRSDEDILASLIEVRSLLAEHVHNTESSFYDAVDKSSIFILGFWPTVKAHKDFLASDKCSEVLAPQDGMLSFCEGRHWRCVGSVVDKAGTRYKNQVLRPTIADSKRNEWIVVMEARGPPGEVMNESWEKIVLAEARNTQERVVFDKFAGADEGKADDGMVLTLFENRTTALLSMDRFKEWNEKQPKGGSENPPSEIWMLRNMESDSA